MSDCNFDTDGSGKAWRKCARVAGHAGEHEADTVRAEDMDHNDAIRAEEREACARLCADRARQLREAIPFAKGESARYLECEARVLEDTAEGIRSRG